jgi:membrane associated rhomboid family serine protease
MIPLKDDNPTHHLPLVTVLLITINCLVHLYHMTLSAQGAEMFVYQYGLIPAEITHFTDMTPRVPFPVWLSPFTSMFLHGDLWHLIGNMLYLWIFGNNVEDFLGKFRFLVFYLLSGLAATGLFVVAEPTGQVPLVGASGAIAGVLGAYLVLFPRARVLTLIWIIIFIRLVWLPALFILGYWFVLQVIMAASSVGAAERGGVAWMAHIGGFAFGWIVLRLFHKRWRGEYATTSSFDDYYNRWH